MRNISYLLKWVFGRMRFFPRYYYTLMDVMLYTKSSRTVYKRAASVKNEVLHTQYYNFFGRLVFGLKEIVALFSHDKVFKKSITLEGFDSLDYNVLYIEGSDNVLWPKSPFIEVQQETVSPAFLQGMAQAYTESYTDNPDKTCTLKDSDYAQAFKAYYFNDTGTFEEDKIVNFRRDVGSLKEIDSKTRKVLNLSFILTEHLEVLQSSFGYYKSYLKSLDLILDYHRYSEHIDHGILANISENRAGNIQTPIYRGQRLTDRVLSLAMNMSEIKKHVTFPDAKRRVIVDIGGGFGHMGRFTHYYVPNSCYLLVELNEMQSFGAYFLRYSFPDKKIALYNDIKNRLDDFPALIQEYDFIILPIWVLKQLPDAFVDLYIATSSIAELSKEYAVDYLKTVDKTLKYDGYFYVNTRVRVEAHSPHVHIHYQWKMQSTFLTLSYQYHPINRMKATSPQWIGKKIR